MEGKGAVFTFSLPLVVATNQRGSPLLLSPPISALQWGGQLGQVEVAIWEKNFPDS